MPRIYQSQPLEINTSIQLDTEATHHIARVLRAKVGDDIVIFNGQGGEYSGNISAIDKKTVTVNLRHFDKKNNESELELYLGQGISRGEKMDYTIQKAVELGVKKIFPILSERCNVKLDDERRDKRLQHWKSIVTSAAEQSGRTLIPDILAPQTLEKFLTTIEADAKFVLAPTATEKLSQHSIAKNARVILLIGPEGGLSEREIEFAQRHQFSSLNLGPRVLRTETAAVAALSVLQFYAGDFK